MEEYAPNAPNVGAMNKPADVVVVQQERKRWLLFGLPFTFTKYTLTNRKILINSGFFTSREDEILLYRVLDMTLSRTLIQKLFGLGTVVVEAQDKFQPTLVVKNIRNSQQFKDNLSYLVEEEKLRLRMRRGEIIKDGFGHEDGETIESTGDDNFGDGFGGRFS